MPNRTKNLTEHMMFESADWWQVEAAMTENASLEDFSDEELEARISRETEGGGAGSGSNNGFC